MNRGPAAARLSLVDKPPLDLKRHFSELFRIVLPIFVLVAAAGIVVITVFSPTRHEELIRPGSADRVGLLPADPAAPLDPAFALARPIVIAGAPRAVRFDFPMGSPLGAMTYNAQPFLTSRHLGDDLNGIGGQDSDRGEIVHAAADGEVIYAGWPSDGWGNVVIVLHRRTAEDGEPVQSLYGHLDRMTVTVGTRVRRGEAIGRVGKGDGRYLAHLHFEMRRVESLDPGGGYAASPLGRLSGEKTLAEWRGAPADRQNEAPVGESAPVEVSGLEIGKPSVAPGAKPGDR
ncbi:MAG: M23 family metallopeptidase [Verrucomicrobiae bacterium]|nr:M23 family metallopeptidase [Verrucomicrobiae bacterium]MCP5538693.1 M23 family metallopeptidase [Akkermansiaceae bacterium]MCP5550582.1 M23 family metallopeptidase [Akkermansiaceae bacterium]